MAAAKIPVINTRDRKVWKLGQFGMTSKYNSKGYRFVSRADVQRLFNESSDAMFTGPQIYDGDFSINKDTWRFRKHNDGSVSFGCQHFSKEAVKKLKRWAGVR